MARIRSIKPEFWTSGQVLECSRNARLLFIGLWNFCDDAGRHPLRSKQIKAQIFPADNDLSEKAVLGLIQELSANGLVMTYAIDGSEYLQVNGWGHQRIDKPQAAKYPPPPQGHSKNIRGTLPPDRKGRDMKGREEEEQGAGAPGFVLDSRVDVRAWEEFEAHRKEIRKPLTDRARREASRILASLSVQQQRECVGKTIASRWTGLFPDKSTSTAPRKSKLARAMEGYHEQHGTGNTPGIRGDVGAEPGKLAGGGRLGADRGSA